jgi:hypothetical protein
MMRVDKTVAETESE